MSITNISSHNILVSQSVKKTLHTSNDALFLSSRYPPIHSIQFNKPKSHRLLLLAFSLAGNFFSAWTLVDCRFLYADPTDFPLPPQPDNSDGSPIVKTSKYTGYVGLYTVERETAEFTPSDSGGESYSRIYSECTPIRGDLIDKFDTKYRVAQLMGVAGLTTGALCTIVIVLTFLMEMCCATPGVQYGLGIMYFIAAATQGLTFLGLDTPRCNALGCVISTTATWSILAVCLYFIALVHSFVVPFPRERICSTECCRSCFPCCGGKDEEEGEEEEEDVMVEEEEEEDDIEAQNDGEYSSDDEDGDDMARAAAAGAAAGVYGADGGGGVDPSAAAAVAGVAAGAAVVGVAAAAAGGGDDDEDDENVELKASVSADAAAASENCATNIASNVYSSVKDAVDSCLPSEGAAVAGDTVGESIPPIESADVDAAPDKTE